MNVSTQLALFGFSPNFYAGTSYGQAVDGVSFNAQMEAEQFCIEQDRLALRLTN